MEVSGQLHSQAVLRALPIRYKVGRHQKWRGLCGKDKNFVLSGIEPRHSSQYPVAIPIELSRLFVLVYRVDQLTVKNKLITKPNMKPRN
jgi:hypothetical protein